MIQHLVGQMQALQPWMLEHRRRLHEAPEVGLELPDTHAYLAGALQRLGLEPDSRPGSGVTAVIRGSAGSGVTHVLRSDMDALPVQEPTGLDFASRRSGAMHACGHDLHMAMLLGAARHLCEHPPADDVVLAFQPGEEADRGALLTLALPALQFTGPATAFALHVNAVLPPHTVNVRSGTFTAHGDWFSVSFHGAGGHAGLPHLTGNPIWAIAEFVSELDAASAEIAETEPVVATVTEVASGNTVNVIPVTGRLRGTLRSLNPRRRADLRAGVRAVAEHAARVGRVSPHVEILEGCPAVENDPGYIAELGRLLAASDLASRVVAMPTASMVIEDFAYFLHRWPGAMVYLGAQVEGGTAFNHSADVLFDEDVLATGVALHVLATGAGAVARAAGAG